MCSVYVHVGMRVEAICRCFPQLLSALFWRQALSLSLEFGNSVSLTSQQAPSPSYLYPSALGVTGVLGLLGLCCLAGLGINSGLPVFVCLFYCGKNFTN